MKRTIGYISVLLLFLAAGYSACTGDDPSPSPADPRQVFAGIWRVNETELRLTYEVNIVLDAKSTKGGVYIYNFANAGSTSNPAYAYVSGTTITLEVNQVIGDGWIVNGSGTLANGKITWPYTLNVGANLYQISAFFTRP